MSDSERHAPPRFTDNRRLLKMWTKGDGSKRVILYQSPTGTYGRWGEYWSDHSAELCWIGDDMGGHFYADAEVAEREIAADYPWTRDVEPVTF